MRNKPKITVVIPVYNGERFLDQAIRSVLAQTYSVAEIIVVDDGSTDSSAQITKRLGGSQVRYVYQTNSGAASARNNGINLAQGPFLAFLDADDIWFPNKLELQMVAFEGNLELDMVFGHITQFRDPELNIDSKTTDVKNEKPVPGYSVCSMLIKQESFHRVGPFSIQWRVGEFIDWYTKALELGLNSILIPETVGKRRIHLSNMGINERKSRADYVRIMKAALDRRRSKQDKKIH